jgi:hypothetical protein
MTYQSILRVLIANRVFCVAIRSALSGDPVDSAVSACCAALYFVA